MAKIRNSGLFGNSSRVMWKETLWLNTLRAFGAGVVWMVLMTLTGGPGNPLGMLIAMPFGYFFVLIPMAFGASLLANFFTLAEVFSWFIALFVAIGDPLVFALGKVAPQMVPVARPSFFSLQMITVVEVPVDH